MHVYRTVDANLAQRRGLSLCSALRGLNACRHSGQQRHARKEQTILGTISIRARHSELGGRSQDARHLCCLRPCSHPSHPLRLPMPVLNITQIARPYNPAKHRVCLHFHLLVLPRSRRRTVNNTPTEGGERGATAAVAVSITRWRHRIRGPLGRGGKVAPTRFEGRERRRRRRLQMNEARGDEGAVGLCSRVFACVERACELFCLWTAFARDTSEGCALLHLVMGATTAWLVFPKTMSQPHQRSVGSLPAAGPPSFWLRHSSRAVRMTLVVAGRHPARALVDHGHGTPAVVAGCPAAHVSPLNAAAVHRFHISSNSVLKRLHSRAAMTSMPCGVEETRAGEGEGGRR